MKISNNFYLQEFVSEQVYSDMGYKSIILLDKKIINIAQFFRDRYGKPITINDWHSGGSYYNSGYRAPNILIGAKYSQHKFGRAVDLKWLDGTISIEEVREDIKEYSELFLHIGVTRIEEDTQSWLHADCANTQLDTIQFIPFY